MSVASHAGVFMGGMEKRAPLRDGPLENLWGGAGEVQKKNSRKGKLNEKKFLQAN